MTRCTRGLVTLAAVLITSSSSAEIAQSDTGEGPRPRAQVVESVKNLGTVAQGRTAAAEFTIRNVGSAPLRILEVQSSCDCISVDFDETASPGEGARIHATLDTRAIPSGTPTMITVRTDDPENERIELGLEVMVEPRLAARPEVARWIYVQHEPEGTIEHTVGALDGAEFRILRVETPGPHFRVSYRPATEEVVEAFSGSQWVVSVTLSEDAPVGPIEGPVSIYTDHPVQELLEIPISGFVRPIAHLTPQDGHFGRIELDRPKNAVFELTNFSAAPLRIEEVQHSLQGLEVRVVEMDAGHRFQIRLTFNPEQARAGDFQETLRIRTDHEHLPVVELPISGTLVLSSQGDRAPSAEQPSGSAAAVPDPSPHRLPGGERTDPTSVSW